MAGLPVVLLDVFCSLAFANVYTAKMPVTAADLLCDRVLPFYEALGVKIRSPRTNGCLNVIPEIRVSGQHETCTAW